jgi:hypothetical protein
LTRDIFQFWSETPVGQFEHSEDRIVLNRMEHSFSRDCLPGPYRGRLLTAPVVLLFLSPGLDPSDPPHCASELGRRYYANQLKGNCDLPDENEHESAYKWLKKVVSKQFDISYEQARSTVATLNIGAYKSERFRDWGMLAALPSSRVCLDWAQSVLFPEAAAGRRTVVCLRSPKYWGLKENYSEGSLFSPKCTRGAWMHHGEMRERVKTAVRSAVLGESS